MQPNQVEKMSNSSNEKSLVRGALKLEVSASTPVITAGNEFSIYVVIRNPFPVPVLIYTTETHIPVELSDQIWRKIETKRVQYERQLILQTEKPLISISNKAEDGADIKEQKPRTKFQKLIMQARFLLSNLASWIRPDPGPRVAVAVSTEEQTYSQQPGSINVNRDFIAGNQYTTYDIKFGEMSLDEIQQRLFLIKEHSEGKSPTVLQPGDSVVKHFILKTSHWLLFTPIAYTFQIQVKYQIDELIHIDTVPFNVSIRAATASSLTGSVIGSILGTAVNAQTRTIAEPINIAFAFVTSMIFAVIIVVAFARKSNVQQIVSVEDFWGGMFIGFLVGYSGESFVQQVLGSN